MHSLGLFLSGNLPVERIGWTLLHFLWQGTLVAGLLAILLALMKGATATARYAVSCCALVLCVVVVIATYGHLAPPPPVKVVLGPHAPAAAPTAPSVAKSAQSPVASSAKLSSISSSPPAASQLVASPPELAPAPPSSLAAWKADIERVLPWIVALWMCGMALASLRLGAGWIGMRSLVRQAHVVTTGEWKASLRLLSDRLGIRGAVQLLESHLLQAPVTFGWLRPVVVFPAALLARLPVEQMEMILAHELAHIRRNDYLVNWLQCLVETVLFYHPAVWWISRRIRAERENCCDDLAAATGDRVLYAQALVSLAEERHAALKRLALAARGGSLLERVKRLVAPMPGRARLTVRAGAGLAFALMALAMGVFALSKIAAHANENAASSPPPKGIVVDAAGKPLADADVMLYWRKNTAQRHVTWESNSPDEIMERVRTDSTGHFQFSKPLTFLPWSDISAGFDSFFIVATAKELAPGWVVLMRSTVRHAQELRIVATPPVARGWIITDKKGQPVSGVEAQLLTAYVAHPEGVHRNVTLAKDTGLLRAVSDQEGRITIPQMPRGDTYIVLRKGDLVETVYTDADSTDSPQKPRKLAFDPGAVITGRVTDEFGRPVAHARVWAQVLWNFEHYDFMFSAFTDDEGRYQMLGVMRPGRPQSEAHGDYRVWIEHPKYALAPLVYHVNEQPDVQTLDLHAHTATPIVGRFVGGNGEPLGEASLRFENPGGRYRLKTDPQGRFHSALPQGRFDVIIETAPPGSYFGRENMYRDLAVANAPLDVDLSPYEEARKVAHISGKAVQPDGSPAVNVEVEVCAHEEFVNSTSTGPFLYVAETRTRADGTFEIAEAPSNSVLSIQARTNRSTAVAFATLDLREGNLSLPQPLQLQPTRTVELLVTDLEGKPRPHFGIRAALLEFGRHDFFATTDDKGVAKLSGIVPGLEYTVTVDAGGWVPLFMTFDKTDLLRRSIVIADEYVVRTVNERGEIIPIESIAQVSSLHPGETRKSNWGSLAIKRPLPDGSVVIQRNLQPFRALKVEMNLVPRGSGEPFAAEGAWPHDGTSILTMHTKQSLLPVEWKEMPDLGACAADEVALLVVNEAGQPVANAAARWMPFDKELAQPPQTDAKGVVRLKRPPNRDDYVVPILEIAAQGYANRWLLSLPTGKGVQVFMDRATRLKGQLVADDGVSSPGRVEVRLMRAKAAREGEGIQQHSPIEEKFITDEAGRYDYPLEPGTYSAALAGANGGSIVSELTVPPSRATTLPPRLGKGMKFRIHLMERATGHPLPGVEVSIQDPHTRAAGEWRHDQFTPQISDEQGWVEWPSLPEAETTFFLKPPKEGPHAFPFGRALSADSLDDYERPTNRMPIGNAGCSSAVRLAVDGQHTSSTIEMERGFHLHGQVKRPDGTGVRCTVVLLGYYAPYAPAEISPVYIKTDAQGHYDQWFPAGNGMSYHVCAFAGKDDAPMANALTESFDSKPGDEFTRDIIVKPGAKLKGRLVNANGPLPAHMKIRLDPMDHRDPNQQQPVADVDPTGHFEFTAVRATRYRLSAFQMQPDRRTTTMETDPDFSVQDGQEVDVGDRVVHW